MSAPLQLAEEERRYAERALEIARRGEATAAPNPMVGCVLVRDGKVLSEGYHERPGKPHGEAAALDALDGDDLARGATAYVNLEPCSHHGRTPPCADRLIAAEVSRVVVAHTDPNPEVRGRGLDRLRAAGVEVVWGGPVEDALLLNLGFVLRHWRGRPAVTLKWAMSLDGKIATHTGESQWISSPEGRRWALGQREVHDAILVGSGTVLADDPRLNRRIGEAPGPITRVVLDRRRRIPPDAKMFSTPGPVLIYSDRQSPADEQPGGEVEVVGVAQERFLENVLEDLASRDVQSVLVEGGSIVLGSFLEAGLFDQVRVCCAPRLIGGARAAGAIGGEGITHLADAPELSGLRSESKGRDLILSGERSGLIATLRQELAC